MKKLIFLVWIVCGIAAQAQTAKTPVLDLIKTLIPDQGQTGNWQTATSAAKSVKWSSTKPSKQVIGYHLSGDAKIDFNGQRMTCGGKSCVISVALNGSTAKAYDQIELQCAPDELPPVAIDKILARSGYQAKVLKKELDSVGGTLFYEVQIPGKPTVWMLFMTIPAYREEQSNDFSLTVFFNKRDLQSRM